MTMGALHEGHLELLKKARHDCDLVVATIFVNPLQFGPNEDFDRYPRTLDDDLKLCAEAGVDVVFAPAVDEVYPGGQPIVKVTPGPMGEVLEGAFRPGFFTGVLTVVNKLLNLTGPDMAFFGQKDAQQLALVRRMVLDLNMPVEIVGVPTVRDEDGLAKSSRNRYLSPEERTTALTLSRALFAGQEKAAAEGADAVRDAANAVLRADRRHRPAGCGLPRARRPAGLLRGPAGVHRRGRARRGGPRRHHPPDRQPAPHPRPPHDPRSPLMYRTMLKSKIHRATVTQADLHYVGSVTIDEDLMDAADLLPGEQVAIVDIDNGARLETYVIPGPRGTGVIGINGAAARLVHPGDLVILISYMQVDDAEARTSSAEGGARRHREPDRRPRAPTRPSRCRAHRY